MAYLLLYFLNATPFFSCLSEALIYIHRSVYSIQQPLVCQQQLATIVVFFTLQACSVELYLGFLLFPCCCIYVLHPFFPFKLLCYLFVSSLLSMLCQVFAHKSLSTLLTEKTEKQSCISDILCPHWSVLEHFLQGHFIFLIQTITFSDTPHLPKHIECIFFYVAGFSNICITVFIASLSLHSFASQNKTSLT